MSRFLHWSIYAGGLLLSGMLIAASLMAAFGYVPFRRAQASAASGVRPDSGRDPDAVTVRSESPPPDAARESASRNDGMGGWSAVWQASLAPAEPGIRAEAADHRRPDAGAAAARSTVANQQAMPDGKAGRSAEERPERPKPQAPAPPAPPGRPAGSEDRRGADQAPGATPVVAGLWPAPLIISPPDPVVDPPSDEGEPDAPADDDGGNGGARDEGDPAPDDGEPRPLRLSLVPGHDEVAAGEIVSVRVVLSEARQVSSVPFHVRFNDDVLEYVAARSGPALAGASLQPILLASVNPERPDDLAVGLALVRSSGRFSGSGTVVVLDFRALRTGHSDLMLEKASVRDASSRPLTVELENSALAVR